MLYAVLVVRFGEFVIMKKNYIGKCVLCFAHGRRISDMGGGSRLDIGTEIMVRICGGFWDRWALGLFWMGIVVDVEGLY